MRPPDPFADRYTKLRLVGRGGFGVVYRAWDTEMERNIALKLLNPELAADEDWRKRFRQEATAASKLNHPNITIVFDRGDYQSQPFIVMEFVEGEPLSKIIENRIPLSDPERLFLIEQLCDGLHYAHQRSIVHRDVKPVNLIVREDHDGTALVRTLKILDFGIAKIVNTGQTSTGGMMFTPSYVSPEQIRGVEVDRRSDMFAVGAVAYELLVGRKAFDIVSKNPFTFLEEVKQKIVEEPHLPMTAIRPDVDQELSAVIDRALAKAPEDRFRDLAEMRRSLHRIRERLEESAPSTSQTTIVLPAKLQAVVKQARQALEADDPSAAILHLQQALDGASNKIVQRFIEQSLEEAQERQAAKKVERRAKDESAARSAIDTAIAEFERGDATLAIRRLDEFQPAELVAEAREDIARAAALVRRAEQIVADGDAAERAAVLSELEQFFPLDLVKTALVRLRARDGLERAVAARAQAAIESAREAFAAGRRSDAVVILEGFEERGRVAAALDELHRANAAIGLASTAVRSGNRQARAEALERLGAFPYTELVAGTLADLRAVDQQLTATEDREQSERAAAARAQAAVKSAREAFAGGKRTEALLSLEQFDDRDRVAAVLEALREANVAIERASTAVRTGARRARAEALEQLEASPHHTLVANALAELRATDQQMRKTEDLERARQREAQERAAREEAAGTDIARARQRFQQGAHQEAIDGLRRSVDANLVADAVRSLERAAAAISRADERVGTSGPEERRAAIDELAQSDSAELAGTALARLRQLDADRSADEKRRQQEQKALEAEKAAAARAQAAIESARDEFSAGNRTAALRTLERFDDPDRVAAALQQLRNAAAAIDKASGAVRHGKADDRAAALDRLAAFPAPELVSRDLAELRTIDRQMAEIEQKAALEQTAQAAIAHAQQRFGEGAHQEAIDGLRQFGDQKLVAKEVESLQKLAAAVTRTEQRVRTGTPEDRRAAIEQFARIPNAGVAAASLSQLRQLDARRSAGEQRQREEKQRAVETERERVALEEERRTLESRARELFIAGSHADALRLLKAFRAPALVADTLRTLREAADEIDAARSAVAREPAPLRRTAIERLERREPKDLFAPTLVELRTVDAERRAAEERAEAERIAAAAERVAAEARQQFARGEHDAALRTLQAFTPVLPPITLALEDLRRDYELILAARAEEEKARKRLEAERAAKVKEVAKLVAGADKAVAEKRFDDAAAVLDGAAQLLPDSGDLAKARTRLARAIDAEERRLKQERIQAVLETVRAPVDRGAFTEAAEKLTEAETLGATATDLAPWREQLRAAQAEHSQISAALAALKESVARASRATGAGRLKDLDRTLSGAVQTKPSALAAAALWPEYREALKQARSLRDEVGIAEAREKVSRALKDGSVRKAERALQEAEASYPGAAAWNSVRAELEALRQARAVEPSLATTAVETVRRNPLILWIAAPVLILVLAVSAWVFWPKTAVLPAEKKTSDVEKKTEGPSLIEQASSRLAAGQRGEALTLALQSFRANPSDQPTVQLLARLRTESANVAATARDKAVSAGGLAHPDFKAAEQKRAEAEALTDPGRTGDAVRAFDDLTQLYLRIETTAFSAARFLGAAQQERSAGRVERALSYALQGIAQYPGDDALTAFLRSLRRDAGDKVAAAREAARKAGATDASLTFRSARDRERAAAARGDPEQTGQALVSLREAEGLYRQAAQEADQIRIGQMQQQQAAAEKLKQDIAAGLRAAEADLKGGRLEAATQAVNGVLARDPNNPNARQLQQEIREAVKERDRIANEAAERKRRQGEAAALVEQAKRASSPQQAVDLLVRAEQLDATNPEVAPLLAQSRLALNKKPDDPRSDNPPPRRGDPPPPPSDLGDEALIVQTLQRYSAAMTARNPGAVLEVFPSARRGDLENTFKMFSEYNFQLQPVSGPQISGTSASIRCTLKLQTNSGQQGRMTQPDRSIVVRLTKAGNRWVVQSLGG